MLRIHPAALAHERKRFMRPDAARYLRPDWRRYVEPLSPLAEVYAGIERKYRPDQPRVPAGQPGGGQWSEEGTSAAAAEEDDALRRQASPARFSPNRAGWHRYVSGPNVVCPAELSCSKEEVADQLARFSVPGRNPDAPVQNNEIVRVYDPGSGAYVGSVQTTISPDGLRITNTTQPGHIFYDGMVTRQAIRQPDGAWMVTTEGTGNNVVPGANAINEAVGPSIFTDLDRQMRTNIERHHDNGIALYRAYGRRGYRRAGVRPGFAGGTYGDR